MERRRYPRALVAALALVAAGVVVVLVLVAPRLGLFAALGAGAALTVGRLSARRSARHGAVAGVVAVVGLVVVVLVLDIGLPALHGRGAGGGSLPFTGPNPPLVRVHYEADLSWAPHVGFVGTEGWVVSARDVAVLRRRASRRARRLPVLSGWQERTIYDGSSPSVLFHRPRVVPLQAPGAWPATTGRAIPVPAVYAPGLDVELAPAAGSFVLVRAPARRVWRTSPSSQANADPTQSGWDIRRVELEPESLTQSAFEDQGSALVLDVASDTAVALRVPDGALAFSASKLAAFLFTALGGGAGVLLHVAPGFVWGRLRRRFHRRPPPPPAAAR